VGPLATLRHRDYFPTMSRRSVSFFSAFVVLPIAALIGASGCNDAAPKRLAEPLAAELETRVNAAQAAADELRKTLSGRLMSTITEQGPVAAIDVCATEAGALTTRVAEQHGVRLGRSSTKLRNGANAPRPWVARHLQSLEGKPAQDAARAVYDLGEELGVAVRCSPRSCA
jgi:hypothetical protein